MNRKQVCIEPIVARSTTPRRGPRLAFVAATLLRSHAAVALRVVVVGVAATLTACSCATAAEGVFSFQAFGGGDQDANVGLSTSKTYLNAINTQGGALTINGVPFEGSSGGNPSGTNYSISGVSNTLDAGGTNNVGGQLGVLLNGFIYNGNPSSFTLNGLTSGQTYALAFYNRAWATAPRTQNITTTSGATTAFNQDFNTVGDLNILRYTFTASGASETVTFTPTVPAATFHFYGFSTEQVFNNSWVSGSDWTTATWSTGTAPNGVGTNADFTAQSSPTTINVDAPVTTGNVRLSGSNAWTISGTNRLTVQADAGAVAVLEASGGRHEISTPLTLNSAVYKAGNGTLALSGAITESGRPITIAAGTLEFASAGSQTVSGAITGAGSVTKSGAGTLTLSGNNTYSGATQIDGGTLRLQGAAAPLLTDNFTANGNPNTENINFNLADRQTGSAATQTWTKGDLSYKTQVGNPTPVQQPAGTGGDYLLLAFDGNAGLNGLPLSTSNVAGPLKINFDMFRGNTGNSTEWTSFTITGSPGNGFPVVGSGEFGFLYRNNTGVQIFNNGGVIENFGSTSGGDSFAFYLADAAGTGSPFAGNGTRVVVKQGGSVLGSYALNAGMGTSYLSFSAAGGMIGGIDNLAVNPQQTNVLDPATVVNLTTTGATLELDNVAQTVAGLEGVAGTAVAMGSFSRLTVNGNTNSTFRGVISGDLAGLTKSGSGTLTLTNASSYTGATTVNSGTLELAYSGDDNGGVGTLAVGSSITVNAGATLLGSAWNALGYGTTHASDQLTINKGGTLLVGSGTVLSMPYALNVVGGTIASVDGGSGVGTVYYASTQGTFTSGTDGTPATISAQNFNLQGASFNVVRGSGTVDLNVTGNLIGNSLVKNGNGVMVLSGANSYTGTTDITAGTIVAANNSALGAGGFDGSTMTNIRDGATLALQGGVTINEHFHVWGTGVGGLGAVRSLSGNNALISQGYALRSNVTVGVDADTLSVSRFYEEGGSYGLTKVGAGTLTLTGSGDYTGGTTINAGTAMLSYEPSGISNTAIGPMTSGNVVTINNGGTLTGSVNNWLSSTGLASGGSNAISVVVNQGGTLRGANGSITGLGNVTLNGGTIEVTNGLGLFGWDASFTLGGDITVSGSTASSITTAAGAGATATMYMSNGANGTGGTRTFTVNDVTGNAASDLVVSARLANGTVVKAGAGTLELAAGAAGTGAAGNWRLDAGTLKTTADNVIAGGVVSSTSDSSTFDLGATTQAVGGVGASGTGNGYRGTIANGTINLNGNNAYLQSGTFTMNLTGGGNSRLWIGGDPSATVSLGGVNSSTFADNNSTIIGYAGTTGAAGTVKLLSAEALGPSGQNTQVHNGSTLDLNGQSGVTVSAIGLFSGNLVNSSTTAASYSGVVDFNGQPSSQIGGSGNITLSGALSSGGFTKVGAGVVNLTGASSYTGATTVSAGKLAVNGSLGNTAVSVASGATLGGSGSIAGPVSVDGFLSPGNSPGVITLGSLVLGGTSTTLIEIAGTSRGTSYDGIDITGSSSLTYGGLLSLDFTALVSAVADNTTFDIFSFLGSASGDFSGVTSIGTLYSGTWTSLGSGNFELVSAGQTLTFSQSTGDIVVVPEPASLALATVGLAASAAVFRRRRQRKTR